MIPGGPAAPVGDADDIEVHQTSELGPPCGKSSTSLPKAVGSRGLIGGEVLDPVANQIDLDDESTWAPLRNRTFRLFWIASLVSNLGTWVHEVGAGWLMTSLDADPSMVSAVRVAISVPMMILAVPMGALADRIDRRQMLIVTTMMLLGATATLTYLTFAGMVTAWWLLTLTFAIGVGMVGHMLSWQATVPELVPRSQLSRAVALGSISFNLARSTGPAIGGVLIALVGTWVAFGFNAGSFACVMVLLLWWRPAKHVRTATDSFTQSLSAGLKYSFGCSPIRAALMNLALFVLPASCLWALLPLYVREDMQWSSRGYGVLVALLGIGAVSAASFLHRIQRRFGFDATVGTTMVIYAVGMCALGLFVHPWVAPVALFAMGSAWMMTLTTLNSTAQLNLPSSIRGRGMSLYVTTMSFSMATGAIVWGRVAKWQDVPHTFLYAGMTLLLAAVISLRFRLQTDQDSVAVAV